MLQYITQYFTQYFTKKVKLYDIDSTMVVIEKVLDLTNIISNIFEQKHDVVFNSNIQINHNYSVIILNNIFPKVLLELIISYMQYDYKLACTVKNHDHILKKGFMFEFDIEHFAKFSIIGHANEYINIGCFDIPFVKTSLIELFGMPYDDFHYESIGCYSFLNYYLKCNYSMKMIEYNTTSDTYYENDKYKTMSKGMKNNVTGEQLSMTTLTEILDPDNLLLLILIINKFMQITNDVHMKKIDKTTL